VPFQKGRELKIEKGSC